MHDQNREKLKLGNQYIIPFKGLKDGEHDFRIDFDRKFFEDHEVLEASDGMIRADIVLNKKPTMLSLSIYMEGSIHIQCHRCLDYFDHPVRFQSDLIVKFGEDEGDSNDEIWILPPESHELDLEQYLFENIGLSLPIQRVHPDDPKGRSGCDPEMIEKLETHSAAVKDADETDPRWNELKKLLNDTNNN